MIGRRILRFAAPFALAALVFAFASPSAPASGTPTPHMPRLAYRCTVAATDLGGAIRVVYRLRSDAPHRRWHVRMRDRKVGFYAGVVRTDAAGRMVVRGRTQDLKGTDLLRVRARNLATGQVCAVSLSA